MASNLPDSFQELSGSPTGGFSSFPLISFVKRGGDGRDFLQGTRLARTNRVGLKVAPNEIGAQLTGDKFLVTSG